MRLLHAEWRRLFARRMTAIMGLVVVGLLGLVALGVAVDSRKPSPAVTAQAARLADQQRENMRELRARCEEAVRDPSTADDLGEFPRGMDCATAFDERSIHDEDFLPNSFNFAREAQEYSFVFGGIFIMVAFAVGASFIGAEWSSGGLMNLLTWRPRRIGVLLTKLAALLSGLLATGTVLAAAWLGVLMAIAQWRGTLGARTTGSTLSLGLDNVRILALALASAALGFSLASLGRRTAAALGVAIGWLVTMEIGLRLVLYAIETPKIERWFASTYIQGWLTKKVEFWDDTHCDYNLDERCQPIAWSVDLNQSALVLGIAVTALLVAAVVAMRRRDVT
jgi:ABC-2 type transport system permease protein